MEGSGDNTGEVPIKKDPAKGPAEAINISIKAQYGTEVQFKIKKSTKMGKVFDAYAKKKAVDINQYRFVFESNRVGQDVTAEDLGLEDGDVIDAFVTQVGGRR